ncbi:MAG: protein translocase subunit SecF [Patescibacteria group bacterium]|nr:protein translocase subunit SecF [Patescibacteria group bacterium]
MNLIKYRKWWYILSLVVIIPGTISLLLFGLKPSIDFTGGTVIEIEGLKDKNKIEQLTKDANFENVTITITNKGAIIRAKPITEEKHKKFKTELTKNKGTTEIRVETVGPSISKEITNRAFISVALASLLIILYLAYVFRKVPRPANSWAFGITAVVGILHDALVLLGIFSLLGHFFNVEVDPLFITAILTVIGFSVHDTVVIYDRIRENLVKGTSETFEAVVNRSLVEMLDRDISTSFLAWIIVFVLYLFGGETIKYFVLALVIGILLGTYSSIFNSASLLVSWQNFRDRRQSK